MGKAIQIIGGGLAGLTLGIALRKRDVPVTMFEAGDYPRHRVCGEFINGRGLEVLDDLGLTEKLLAAGAIRAGNAAFFTDRSRSQVLKLPEPALCLSRFVLDHLLAGEFDRLGGELKTGERWQNGFGEGIVRATGRRAQPVEDGWRWFGLKAHARNVALVADLEMHLGKNNYVGICRLADDEVNICGLFRRRASDPVSNGFDRLRGETGSILAGRLARAQFDQSSFCSVAGLSLRPQHASDQSECRIGDALTMIPPVTGNGMSLAFESAQLAVEPLTAFSRGELDWAGARRAVGRRCDERFLRRLAWAARLQSALFSSLGQTVLLGLAARSDWFWRWAFGRTR